MPIKLIAVALLLSLFPTGSRAQDRKAPIPPGTTIKRDIDYVPNASAAQKLDLAIPPSKEPLPLVIWVHGGGWQKGDKTPNPAVALLQFGYTVAGVNYRLTQEAIFPAQINDCKAAVRWLRANAKEYNIDPDRIGVWGASAGGHLVALLGTAGDAKELEGDGGNEDVSSRVQAVCDFFGPSDLTRVLDPTAADNAVPKLMGGPLREKRELAAQASPVTYVTSDDPPFLIMHGGDDPLVHPRQSRWLYEALRAKKVPAQLKIIDGAKHGGPEFATPEHRKMILQFFDKTLKHPSPPKAE
jgi:acetyl esterase/lipase